MRRDTRSVGLMHSALFYAAEQDFLAVVLPFVRDGIAKREPVHIALPTPKLVLLREALGDAADVVNWADTAVLGRNPARTFPMFAAAIGSAPAATRIRWVAEPIWPGCSAEHYPAFVRNEALFNLAFAGEPLLTLCPFDAANLPEEVIADARRTHPLISQGGEMVASPDYSWQAAFQDCDTALATDPSAAALRIDQLVELSAARSFAADHARVSGLAAERIGDLTLIVTELATNSLKYGGGSCRLALWTRDGNLVCEVRDDGQLDDSLAGRRLPRPLSAGGRGLLLVNALADSMRVHTSQSGTTIQVYLALNPSEQP